MEKLDGVHLLYKNLGETPLQCLERFRTKNPEYQNIPMTYAGRLDPMAEGLLLVLSGNAVREKEKYLGLPKTYVCEMLWGFETDSLDVLGVVSSEISFWSQLFRGTRKFFAKNFAHSQLPASESPRKNYDQTKFPSGNAPTVEVVEGELEKMVGKFEQRYPAYSSRPVGGVPLFQLAREGRLAGVEVPKHEVELLSAEFISRRTISGADLLAEIERKISLVSGDFRQKEIMEKWRAKLSKGVLDTVVDTFTIDKILVEVSSGFYVRQFVSDLAEKLGAVATTFHIKRTKVGEFSVEND